MEITSRNTCIICIIVLQGYFQPLSVKASEWEKRKSKEERLCPISKTSMVTVDSCPTKPYIQDRSREKNCEVLGLCQGEPLVYHCIKYGKRLVEVCAPRTLITGGSCAEYDKGVGRVVEDYETPCPDCPFHYQSDETLMYYACIKTHDQKDLRSRDGERSVISTTETEPTEKRSSGKNIIGPVALCLAVAAILLVILVGTFTYRCIYKKQKEHNCNKSLKDDLRNLDFGNGENHMLVKKDVLIPTHTSLLQKPVIASPKPKRSL